MSEKTVIEVQGVKLEVDLRHAKRIDTISIGTRVKVLKKEYSDSWKVRHGIVIGFEPFQNLPTIIICTALIEYAEAKIEFLYYNAKSEGVEVVVASDDDLVALDKADFCAKCDLEIEKHQSAIKELQHRKGYFLDKFQSYWKPIEEAVRDATATE